MPARASVWRVWRSTVLVDAVPFRALRYDSAVAGDAASTSAPPYDELERFAYARHRTASPYTVLELVAPGPAGDFAAAGATLRRWLRTGVLTVDPVPAFYRYEEHELRHGVPAVQRGLLAAVRLEPPGHPQTILPHERVDPGRVAARIGRLEAVPVDLSPVFALFLDAPLALRQLLRAPPPGPPVTALSDETGVDHRVWALSCPRTVTAVRDALAGVRVILADGHHRYATAVAFSRRQRGSSDRKDRAAAVGPRRRPDRGRDPDPTGGPDRTLMYLADAQDDGPQLLAVHRLVRALRPDAFDLLAEDFELSPAPADADRLEAVVRSQTGPVLGLRLPGGVGLLLRARAPAALRDRLPPGHSPEWAALDSALLDHAVLPRICDPAAADVVQYRSDAPAAAGEVEAGGAAALFLLRPVDAGTVFALASAGERMPVKTTWFRPKPRAGLIMRLAQPALAAEHTPGRRG